MSKQTQCDNTYTVGYGRPPTRQQFQKGRSGNPAGRPRRTPNLLTVLERALAERVTVVENGKEYSISKLESVIERLMRRAGAGDARATAMLLPLMPMLLDEGNVASLLTGDADQRLIAAIVAQLRRSEG